MKPLPSPRCVVALSLGLFAVATRALAATAATAATDPAPAPATEAGWMSRLAAAPAKLAFWKKDDAPAPAPAAAASPAPKPAKSAAKPAAKPAAPPAPPASTPSPAGAPTEETSKAGFFSHLPSLPNPFAKKPAAPPADIAPKTEKPVAKASQPPEKKSNPATRDTTAAAAPDATAKEKPGPAAPEASKKTAGTKSKSAPATEPAAAPKAKPSLWSRMGSAVLPGKTATPTAPVRPSHPIAAAEPNGSTFVITKDESPFFTFGPHQATAPDAYLSTGTLVTVQEKSWGWAQVQLPDGRSGTIARNALRPATASDLVPASLPRSLMAAATSRRSGSADSYVMPPAAMPDLPTGPTGPDSAAETEELSSALLPPFVE